MTRINLVNPVDLADQHLFAEWREIKMIPAKLRKVSLSYWNLVYSLQSIPHEYTMNTGHVRFFYNKVGWLRDRYIKLTAELENRKFNISETNAHEIFIKDMFLEVIGSYWSPSNREIKISIERITERLYQRPNWYRYYGEVKPPEFFIERYNQQLLVDKLVDVC